MDAASEQANLGQMALSLNMSASNLQNWSEAIRIAGADAGAFASSVGVLNQKMVDLRAFGEKPGDKFWIAVHGLGVDPNAMLTMTNGQRIAALMKGAENLSKTNPQFAQTYLREALGQSAVNLLTRSMQTGVSVSEFYQKGAAASFTGRFRHDRGGQGDDRAPAVGRDHERGVQPVLGPCPDGPDPEPEGLECVAGGQQGFDRVPGEVAGGPHGRHPYPDRDLPRDPAEGPRHVPEHRRVQEKPADDQGHEPGEDGVGRRECDPEQSDDDVVQQHADRHPDQVRMEGKSGGGSRVRDREDRHHPRGQEVAPGHHPWYGRRAGRR